MLPNTVDSGILMIEERWIRVLAIRWTYVKV